MGIQHKHKCKERSKSRNRRRNRDNMDRRNVFIVLMLVVVANSKVFERRDEEGRLFGESMVEVVQRLVRDVNVLKTDNINLKKDNENLKKDSDNLKKDNINLKKDSDNLKKDNINLKEDNENMKKDNINLKKDSEGLKKDNSVLKAEVSRLKANGHSDYSVADQQWQSLHMAAAAACRASTAFGGHGINANQVYPRTKGQTCDQVCKATKYYTECDASLSIMGTMGRVKTVNRSAGAFYNYHCNSAGYPGLFHEESSQDNSIAAIPDYLGYCCCRKP